MTRCLIVQALLVTALLGVCNARQASGAPEKFTPRVLADAVSEGNVAFERKDYSAARNAYNRVLAIDSENLLGLVNLGMVEFYSGHADKAEEVLKKAVRQRLESAPAWLTLGMIYMDRDQPDAALAALSQAMLQDPKNARTRNFLGVVMGRRGWIEGAQHELRRAVELDPSYADAHYNLAVFYLEEKPPAIELARRHYQKAIELGVEKNPSMENLFNAPTKKP